MTDVIRYHTAGRRQPQLIGKDPAGVPIWGGPYTLYQVGALLIIPVGWQTRGVWGSGLSGLAVISFIALATVALIWLLGRIDFSGRNIVCATTALLTAWLRTITPPRIRSTPVRVRGWAVCARHPRLSGADDLTPDLVDRRPAGSPSMRAPRPAPASVQPHPAGGGAPPAAKQPAAGAPIQVRAGDASPLAAFLAAAGKVR